MTTTPSRIYAAARDSRVWHLLTPTDSTASVCGVIPAEGWELITGRPTPYAPVVCRACVRRVGETGVTHG